MRKNSIGKIPRKTYSKIIENMPIPCVDAVITHGQKFLLGKRNNRPVRNSWWLIGGRILKNETLVNALKRKITEETGLVPKKIEFVTVTETVFPDSEFGHPVHTINSLFLVEVEQESVSPDIQHSELKWFTKINPRWHSHVKKSLGACDFL